LAIVGVFPFFETALATFLSLERFSLDEFEIVMSILQFVKSFFVSPLLIVDYTEIIRDYRISSKPMSVSVANSAHKFFLSFMRIL
jgi:hypothetical protein